MAATKPNYCPNCGKDTVASDIFCASCGHQLVTKPNKSSRSAQVSKNSTHEKAESSNLGNDEVIQPLTDTKVFSFRRLWLKWFLWSSVPILILYFLSMISSEGDKPTVIEIFLGGLLVGAMLGGMISLVGAIIHKHIYLKKHPELNRGVDTDDQTDEALNGVSGWLGFFVLGQVLTSILVFTELLASIGRYSAVVANGYSTIANFEVFGNLVMLGLAITVIFLILKRRKAAVKVVVIYLVSAVLLLLIDTSLASSITTDTTSSSDSTSQTSSDSSRTFWVAAIWIPYFLRSRRVKMTLTE